jgi:hypothetical protein
MKLRHGRHRRDALPSQLCQLLPFGCVNVDEAVHVADAETLDRVWGVKLPLGAETVLGAKGLVREGVQGVNSIVLKKIAWEGGFGAGGEKERLHSDPAAGLVVVFDDCRRSHLLI